MLRFFRKKPKPQEHSSIDVTLDQVREAVRSYEESLSELGLNRTILIQPDHSIDFKLLVSQLGGLPSRNFYMSRETFEIFEEEEKHFPYYLDLVQKAVDEYVIAKNRLPVVEGSYSRKVNYDLLINDYYLKEKPPFPIYISDQNDLVTHNANWR